MGQKWRSNGIACSDDEGKAVVILSSSDDDEANEDLSLRIVERAKKREAKRKKLEGVSVSVPVIDLSSTSSDEANFASGRIAAEDDGFDPAAPVDGNTKNKKKKKPRWRKKRKAEENGDAHTPVENKESLGTTDSMAVEGSNASDNMIFQKMKKKVEENGDVVSSIEEEDPLGTTDSMAVELNGASNDIVFRKLLRGTRYFDDPGDKILESCYNCGEEGHVALNCTMEKRKRPCFVCGMFGHGARQCSMGQECYICKERGHFAKDCPDKHKLIPQDTKLCLRCGRFGHEMSSCKHDFFVDDLKEIRCYICNKYGHLCCAKISFDAPKEVSCYNCAQFGHTGSGCARQRGEASSLASPPICYKCGGGGHFARGCTYSNSKPTRKFPKKSREPPKLNSAPHDLKKAHKKGSIRHEERRNSTGGQSRVKGGWLVDDPGDMPRMKQQANNGWMSPKTPARNCPSYHSVAQPDMPRMKQQANNGWMSPKTPARNNPSFHSVPPPWPSSSSWGSRNGSHSFEGTPRQDQRFSASRFGNSPGHSWRI